MLPWNFFIYFRSIYSVNVGQTIISSIQCLISETDTFVLCVLPIILLSLTHELHTWHDLHFLIYLYHSSHQHNCLQYIYFLRAFPKESFEGESYSQLHTCRCFRCPGCEDRWLINTGHCRLLYFVHSLAAAIKYSCMWWSIHAMSDCSSIVFCWREPSPLYIAGFLVM